ncbi:MAG: YSC84-related protein [Mangrovicoccus sp.]|nr:YSC84-related protein [Mangrovicoccus sp.]
MMMTTRRGLLVAGAALMVAACDNSVGSNGGQIIDARVQNTLSIMYQNYPETIELADRAAGMLVMPLIGSAGFVVGGSYGEGSLIVRGATLDYYSALAGSVGFQIGAKESSQVIFFMTPEALADFRGSAGWEMGAGVTTLAADAGGTLSADTRSKEADVISFVFNERGLQAAATLSGIKYQRILR